MNVHYKDTKYNMKNNERLYFLIQIKVKWNNLLHQLQLFSFEWEQNH